MKTEGTEAMLTLWLFCALSLVAETPGAATQACAHRGDKACAPENTLPAIRSAVEKGAAQIEFDVQATRDGQLVIMHDATVDRTTDGKGKVSELAFDEVRALDAGTWFGPQFKGERVPTLKEVLQEIPKTILCNVHLKNTPGVAAASAKMIQDLGKLDHCFLACTEAQAAEAHTVVPEILICNMDRQDGNRKSYIDKTLTLKCAFIQLHHKEGTEGLKEDVARLHAAGVRVNWFGAQEEGLIRLLAEAGVDYVLTDDLDLCHRVLKTSER
jgi:glycerophosphoryl diester phosphodiesterase